MATFASSSLAKKAAGEDDEESTEQPISKSEPKVLKTYEIGSIFELKNELLKKKDIASQNVKFHEGSDYIAGRKGGILKVKKDEKELLKNEGDVRRAKIRDLEKEIRREDEERLAAASKRLKEKSELYDRLQNSGKALIGRNNEPVDFMVDFVAKKREEVERVPPSVPGPSSRDPPKEHFAPDEEGRVYGASHMRFSANEDKRNSEIENLLAMSKRTDESRKKFEELQERREVARKEKIAKLRKRLGLPELKEPTPPPQADLDEIPLPVEEMETPEQQILKRIKSDREWDRGKDRFCRWIDEQRDDRDDDFKPPDSYFK